MPKLTRATSPSARTSERRALTWATGRSLATSRVTTGAPKNASGSASGSVSKQSETASSVRWSSGHSGLPSPFFSQMGLVLPTVAGDATASVRFGPGASSIPSGLRCHVRSRIRGLGHASSATHPPGACSRTAAGGAESCIQARIIGSSAIPASAAESPAAATFSVSSFSSASRPLSHRSHHRRLSSRKPTAGPGFAWCGYWWPHGPTRALRGTSRCSISRNTGFV